MRTASHLSVLLVLSWTASLASAQSPWNDKAHFHELFRCEVDGEGEDFFLNVTPDSMQAAPAFRDRYTALYWANDYLYSNYSTLYKHQKEIIALRKDRDAMKQRFAERMAEDTAFQRLYLRSVNREIIAPLHIDSALRIAAHFYYVHKMNGQPTVHICIGINKVKDLSMAMEHPYYAAFCYMAIWELDEVSAPYKQVREPFSEEVKAGVSDARIEEIEQEIYKRVAALPMMRQVLIDAYTRKAQHLNFELIP